MKRLLSYAIILASFSIPAFAAKNSQSITITNPIKVGSTQLTAGDYKVSWTGTSPNVQVTIAARGKAAVTIPAKLVDTKNGHVALLTNTVGGALVLESIQFDNVSLVLTSATSAGE
jgi:hypothetical protein